MPNLTDRTIKAATVPARGSVTLWDSSLTGFGLRVGQGGTKTFIVLIASGRRQKIGRYPTISLQDARAAAKTLLAEKQLGRLRPIRLAYADAEADFLTECAAKNKPKTVKDYTRLLRTHFPFARKSIGDITPRDMVKRLNAIVGKPSEKHHAFVAAKVFFTWCVKQQLIDRSPMEQIAPPPLPRPRERVLSTAELTRVYQTARAGTTPFHRIVTLITLTGQRRSEIASLKWSWIKDAHIHFPTDTTKNKQPHTLPLVDTATAVLATCPQVDDSPYVFPAARKRNERTTVFNGWSKAKAAFDVECGVRDWTLHDIRRTVATGLAALGVTQAVTEKILNHTSGDAQSPLARVYNRYQYRPEISTALHSWEQYLNGLADDET